MELSEIQKLVYEEYKKNGYLEMWTIGLPHLYSKEQELADLAELGLFHTEVSEAMEAIREHGYPMLRDKLGEEIADLIIRALNFASRKDIDVESHIISKHETNLERGIKHGKKI